MRLVAIVAVIVAGSAFRAEASCVSPSSSCFCFSPTRVGVVVTQSVEGARATVHVESPRAGLVADQVLTLPREQNETPGTRWLLLNEERRRIDDQAEVGCPAAGYPGTRRVGVEAAADAVLSVSCDEKLDALGFNNVPCNDVARGCSVSPVLLLPLILVSLLLRRRRRSR